MAKNNSMKMSDRMIKGWETVDGMQTIGAYVCYDKDKMKVVALCALGASSVGSGRGPCDWERCTGPEKAGLNAFEKEYGQAIHSANDAGLLPEEIIGMLQAIGQ